MRTEGAQPEQDAQKASRWEKPFGSGMAVSFVPLAMWLVVVFVGIGPHSGPGAGVVPLVGAVVFVSLILAFFGLLWRQATRSFALGIGTGLLMSLGLYFTLGMVTFFGCGFLC